MTIKSSLHLFICCHTQNGYLYLGNEFIMIHYNKAKRTYKYDCPHSPGIGSQSPSEATSYLVSWDLLALFTWYMLLGNQEAEKISLQAVIEDIILVLLWGFQNQEEVKYK